VVPGVFKNVSEVLMLNLYCTAKTENTAEVVEVFVEEIKFVILWVSADGY
jgi:hypothetical protein